MVLILQPRSWDRQAGRQADRQTGRNEPDMPTGDEYSAGGGGKLKLKGSKVSDGRIEKKKAKKAKKKEQAANNEATSNDDGRGEVEKGRGGEDSVSTEDSARIEESRREEDKSLVAGKTETERQYEETRKKRVRFFLLSVLVLRGGKSNTYYNSSLNAFSAMVSRHIKSAWKNSTSISVD